MPASPRRTQLPTSKTPVANKPGKVAAPKAQPIKKPATPQYSNSGQTGGAPSAMAPMASNLIGKPVSNADMGTLIGNISNMGWSNQPGNRLPNGFGGTPEELAQRWANDPRLTQNGGNTQYANDPGFDASARNAIQGFFADPKGNLAAPPSAFGRRPAAPGRPPATPPPANQAPRYANEAGRLNAQLQSTSITPEQRARIEQRMKFKGYDANTPAMSSAQLQQSAPKAYNKFFPATGPVSPTTGLATQPGAPVLDRSTVTYQNEQPQTVVPGSTTNQAPSGPPAGVDANTWNSLPPQVQDQLRGMTPEQIAQMQAQQQG